jgi:hypothetical protein
VTASGHRRTVTSRATLINEDQVLGERIEPSSADFLPSAAVVPTVCGDLAVLSPRAPRDPRLARAVLAARCPPPVVAVTLSEAGVSGGAVEVVGAGAMAEEAV